ncbi:MAG: flagellar filament capping protein FliD [Fimbriimonadaceae bacterium]
MSINGPQSGIRFTGLASGLDVESIVTQLVNLQRFPIQRLQAQQAQLQAKQTIFGQFRSNLISLSSAASALNFTQAFQTNAVTSADSTIASGTVTDAAVPGIYNVNVTALARAHKLTSAAQNSPTDELGFSGSFMVKGKAIDVVATDTLTTIASKINGLGTGVSANIINGGVGSAFLVIGGTATGAENEVLVSDVTGTAAQSLGLVNTGSSLTRLTGSIAKSSAFSNSTDTLKTLTGATASGVLSLGLDGIAFDTTTDTLQDIVDRVNATGNHTASIVTEKVDGVDKSRIEIDSASWPAGYSDSNNLLGILGITKDTLANQVTGASDAQVQIDGVTVNSPKNTLSNVVGGMTLNLNKVGTTTLTVNRDNAAIKGKITDFQKAYNDVIGYIRSSSQFDQESFQTGPLFGDQTTSQVESALNTMLFGNAGTGSIKNLAEVGFSLDDQGKLELDSSKLDSALSTKADDVRKLFMATGTSLNSELTYVSSGNKSIASTGTGYDVNITQVATKGAVSALNAFSAPHSGGETLTFSGSLFGGSSLNLTISAGSDLNSLVSQINSDSRFKDSLVATNNGGSLNIVSKRYGTAGNFTVTSNLTEGPDNSGIGTGGGTNVAGVNVAGTINGETATGSGQFLLGSSGNAKTDGLQILYKGTTTGAIGAISFNRGVAALMNFQTSSFTDSVNGLITTVDQTLTAQVQDIQDRITSLNDQLILREQTIRARFTAMEQAISRANAQGSQLSNMLNAR